MQQEVVELQWVRSQSLGLKAASFLIRYVCLEADDISVQDFALGNVSFSSMMKLAEMGGTPVVLLGGDAHLRGRPIGSGTRRVANYVRATVWIVES